jgi:dienelactone hydrolase
VVFPGYGYRCSGPLLHYATSALTSLGADVLWVEYAYDRQQEYGKLEAQGRKVWRFTDSKAGLQAALKVRPYRRTTLVGKSLGTRVIAELLTHDASLGHARIVWLTPLLTDQEFRTEVEQLSNCSLFIIGSADDYYDGAVVDLLRRKPEAKVVVVDGANHSLEINGNLARSVEILGHVVQSIQEFVSGQ